MQTNNPNRHNKKWLNTEINSLHNDYELKKYTVSQIAEKHERTVFSILNKLAEEGLINSSWNDARGWNHSSNQPTKCNESIINNTVENEDLEDDPEDYEDETEDYEEEDDPNDEDYVPEHEDEDEDDDDEDDDEGEDKEDILIIKQKLNFLEKKIENIYKYLRKNGSLFNS